MLLLRASRNAAARTLRASASADVAVGQWIGFRGTQTRPNQPLDLVRPSPPVCSCLNLCRITPRACRAGTLRRTTAYARRRPFEKTRFVVVDAGSCCTRHAARRTPLPPRAGPTSRHHRSRPRGSSARASPSAQGATRIRSEARRVQETVRQDKVRASEWGGDGAARGRSFLIRARALPGLASRPKWTPPRLLSRPRRRSSGQRCCKQGPRSAPSARA